MFLLATFLESLMFYQLYFLLSVFDLFVLISEKATPSAGVTVLLDLNCIYIFSSWYSLTI